MNIDEYSQRQIKIELNDAAQTFFNWHRKKPTPAQLIFAAFQRSIAVTEATAPGDHLGFRSMAIYRSTSAPNTRSEVYTPDEVSRAETLRSHFENLISGRNHRQRRQVLVLFARYKSSRQVGRECKISHQGAIDIRDGCLDQISGALRELIALVRGVKSEKPARTTRSSNKINAFCTINPA